MALFEANQSKASSVKCGERPILCLISGCSSGGKSTLLAELAHRGHAVVQEPGRRIVAEELRNGGRALPWVDLAAFARRAIDLSLDDLASVPARANWVFFDRGLIDAAAALDAATGATTVLDLSSRYRFHSTVFMAPPWPEIFVSDRERKARFEDALSEYDRLTRIYRELGYRTIVLPKCPVPERADFVIDKLRNGAGPNAHDRGLLHVDPTKRQFD